MTKISNDCDLEANPHQTQGSTDARLGSGYATKVSTNHSYLS